jgi:hypothetical protein
MNEKDNGGKPMKRYHSRSLTFLLPLALFAGCASDTSEGKVGEMNILLTDAPGDFEKVPIEIEGVQAHLVGEKVANPQAYRQASQQQQALGNDENAPAEQGQWIDIMLAKKNVDLLKLQNGVQENIGQANIPSGFYNQLRLLLKKAQVVVNQQVYDLTIPSGETSGLKIMYKFEVTSGQAHELTLDFDAKESIKAQGGGYQFNPVIQVKQYRHQGRNPGSDGGGGGSGEQGNGQGGANQGEQAPQGGKGDAGTGHSGQ